MPILTTEVATCCVACGGDRWSFVREGCDLYRPHDRIFKLGRCLACGHISQIPTPDQDELNKAYSVTYAPYRAAWKQSGWPLWKVLREITTWRRMKRLGHYANGRKLLEVGSGAGDFLYAADRAGWDVSAVEYSSRLAEMLRSEIGVDVRAGELKRGVWEPGHFDVVAFWNVLEHLRDPLDSLRIAAAYLRPGGAVFIQIPTRRSAEIGRWFGPWWQLLDLPRHLNFFSRNSLARLCAQAGLDLTVFKTSFLDMAWCYLASAGNYASQSKTTMGRMSRFGLIAAIVILVSPWLALQAWRGRGTEAFAVAIKS